MDTNWKVLTWRQYGAALDMLENAIRSCPENVWSDPVHKRVEQDFWYLAYHTLFFLDYYLSESEKGFAPPAPFTLSELDPDGAYPERVYTKEELLSYLRHGHEKCRRTIAGMTAERASEDCGFKRREMSRAELLLYGMRHVQHHAAQLNLLLRQKTDGAPRWVSKSKVGLDAE